MVIDNSKLFDNWSSTYDESVKESDKNNEYPFAGYSKIKKEIFDIITKRKNLSVLEMGIGTGEISFPLYQSGYIITGVDLSIKMIDISKKRMPTIRTINLDFLSAVKFLITNKYDVVIFNYSIHHLCPMDQIDILKSLSQILNEDGLIIIGDVMTSTNLEMSDLTEKYKDIWDKDEYYPTFENYNNIAINQIYDILFKQITHCSGLMILTIKS